MRTRIKNVDFFEVTHPISKPIADSTHNINEIAFVVARIELESGITGDGCLVRLSYSPNAIKGALQDIKEMVKGLHAYETGKLIQIHNSASEYFGTVGLQHWALGIVNIAMWDAWAKSLEQPIWKLFGVHYNKIPAYGSGGWLSYNLNELLDEVGGYVKKGFRAVKIKVGSPDIGVDLERIAKVREKIGPHLKIMMDANQGMDLSSAIQLANRVKKYDIGWFEEPLSHSDFAGYKTLRSKCDISLAMGEREFDTIALRELIAREAIDLWQPDIVRLGGVEGWRDSAAFAEAHRIPVLPHYYKEYDVALLCTIKNPCGCETFDWVDGLIDHPIKIANGYAFPHETPGWGFEFLDDKLIPIKY
ncbi:MAG: mandelate racemase/muconate lactonizing enzyme family protein [Candidatus Ratteibacteria bacterium]